MQSIDDCIIRTMKYKNVIFDLDGTLLDSVSDIYSAVNKTLEYFDYPLRTKEEIKSFLGHGSRFLIEKSIGSTPYNIDEIVDFYTEYYTQYPIVDSKPYEGIIEMLGSLKGVNTYVLSNKDDLIVQKIHNHFFKDYIDHSFGVSNVIYLKPSVKSFDYLKEKFGLKERDTLFVGDTKVDHTFSLNANLDCVLCTWGFTSKKEILKLKAKYSIDEPMELLKILN